MNDLQKITPSGFFVLRTPLLPFDELAKLDLAAMLARPEVREAIFLASPDLDESIEAWRRDPQSERGRRIERALYRYVARMCGRATPFGLFAGCTLGRVANETRLCLGPRSSYRRLTRFDTEYLLALCEEIARDRELRASLRFRTNTSLYRAAGRIHYVEANGHGDARGYRLVAAEPSPYLDRVLERARDAATPAELAASLVDDEIELDEAMEFVDELIDVQLLVSELAPALTGGSAIDDVMAQLPKSGVQKTLQSAQHAIEEIDRGFGHAPDVYRDVAAKLQSLPAPVELAHLFQVDLVKPAAGVTLGRAVLAEIERGVGILHRIGAYQAPRDDYDRFREAFLRRYERRWVPLVEALDDETGI
ncbi:MAG TPA: lantibiotic dehydratase family protein, partial [Thermoanaerobaculia bacterium]|nr:lantibiotic dehydratase family protein [Thermoanaerobaculia bacterium]